VALRPSVAGAASAGGGAASGNETREPNADTKGKRGGAKP